MAHEPTFTATFDEKTLGAWRSVAGADFEREKCHTVRKGGLPARWSGLFLLPGGRPRGGMLVCAWFTQPRAASWCWLLIGCLGVPWGVISASGQPQPQPGNPNGAHSTSIEKVTLQKCV